MREILFRGKRTDNGEWVYGSLLVDYPCCKNGVDETVKLYSILDFKTNEEEVKKVEVIPETVGQYTGLTDKNGTKIFEGDILKNEKGTIYSGSYRCEVVFRDGMFLAEGFVAFSPNEFELCEVIGNIHDNPELLEAWK